jgi:hypothetical protein
MFQLDSFAYPPMQSEVYLLLDFGNVASILVYPCFIKIYKNYVFARILILKKFPLKNRFSMRQRVFVRI